MGSPSKDGLGELFELLECDPAPAFHIAAWRRLLGDTLANQLVVAGILVRMHQETWYPCERSDGSRCRLRVVDNPDQSSDYPFIATCPYLCGGCRPIPLVASDLVKRAFLREAFVREVRRAFGVTGQMDFGYVGYSDVIRIGDLKGRPAYLAFAPGHADFDEWIARQGRAYVMVPVGRWMSPATFERCAPGREVELIVLREALEFGEQGLVANWPKGLESRGPVCVMHDMAGLHELTARQYREVVARVAMYDLFVDMTAAVDGGGYRGVRKNPDGTTDDVVLTKLEAAVIFELASTGRPLRAGEIKGVDVEDVEQLIERARRKVDVRLGRYKWRALHTLAGGRQKPKRWRFVPSSNLQWCVVVPV